MCAKFWYPAVRCIPNVWNPVLTGGHITTWQTTAVRSAFLPQRGWCPSDNAHHLFLLFLIGRIVGYARACHEFAVLVPSWVQHTVLINSGVQASRFQNGRKKFPLFPASPASPAFFSSPLGHSVLPSRQWDIETVPGHRISLHFVTNFLVYPS